MALVYRLESKVENLINTEVNTGVYHGMMLGDECDGFVEAMQTKGGAKKYHKTHPGPSRDIELSQHKLECKHVFCCTSIESLHNWFNKIDDAGDDVICQLQIGIYFVPDEHYHKGMYQAVADRFHMKRVDTWEPTRRG